MLLLPAGNASEWTGPTGNNTYLFPSTPSILIDAGVGHPDHIAAIERELGGEPLDFVLITHNHTDHVAGVPALLERWPDLDIFGGPGAPLGGGKLFVTDSSDRGSAALTAIYTPGHAPDHFCFFDVVTGDVYCGDLARLGGTVVIPFSRGGNLGEYLESLQTVRRLKPSRLLPAHGEVILDPERLIDEYVAHRADRQRQIVVAIADGCVDLEAIVARLYPDLSPTLLEAARETVLAHLEEIKKYSQEERDPEE